MCDSSVNLGLFQGEETQVVDPRVIHVMLAVEQLEKVCWVSVNWRLSNLRLDGFP